MLRDTTNVVRAWIEKSKQPAQPSTSLQALVNLRRLSLRLTPADADAPADTPHLLEPTHLRSPCTCTSCFRQATPTPPATASTTEPAAGKITIRLVAIDAAGRELDSPNEQTVYLLVQRFGERASPDGEDARPWVVKREATINPHTHDPRAGVATPAQHRGRRASVCAREVCAERGAACQLVSCM
ncbi:hypothetical protein B0H10DRAFT_916556 [Mycena sp. CBHHK59/15]|nr:hypothetical protein B0H10DRAFT_916556 [Mycena sp. CBHHK59/15]